MKTAVEWLENEIQKSIIPAQKDYFKWAFSQAKEMEKKQIENAYNEGVYLAMTPSKTAEDYYNKTFKSE